MTPRWLALLPAALLGAGCSSKEDYDLSANAEDASDTAMETDTDRLEGLRIDVTPPSDVGLLPQSFPLDAEALASLEGGSLSLSLRETVTVSGLLTASVLDGIASAEAPSSLTPLDATLSFTHPDGVQGAYLHTLSDGRFEAQLPASDDYQLLIQPSDATETPLRVEAGLSFLDETSWSRQLDPGVPVFGRLVDADGVGLGDVPLRLVQGEDTSSVFYTDATGWFLARSAAPDDIPLDLTLEVLGGPARQRDGTTLLVPSFQAAFTLDPSAGDTGARVTLDAGPLAVSSVVGRVLGPDDRPLADATVRLDARALAGDDTGDGAGTRSYTVVTNTQDNGYFVADVPPGAYTLTLLPPYGSAGSPLIEELDIPEGRTELAERALPASAALSGRVLDASGGRASGVAVSARNLDEEGYIYNTTTDSDGDYAFSLPAGDYKLLFTPPDGTYGAVTTLERASGASGDVQLRPGQWVSGSLLTPEGQGVGFALIEIRDVEAGLSLGYTLTGPDGTFALSIAP